MLDPAPSRKWIWAACLLLLACGGEGIAGTQPSEAVASGQEIESKISSLLARMTLAEKVGQLQQLDGTWEGDVRPDQMALARQGLLGSALYVRGAKRTAELQRMAMNESRLKIPILFASDVIHGYRTIFPVPLG